MAGFSRSHLVAFLFLSIFSSSTQAKEFLVGGKSDSWAIPASQQSSLSEWAQTTRFRVGDTLVWNYDGNKDSVLEVTKEAFEACNVTSPLAEHKDGETKVKLSRAGPYYFISGAKGHCEKGQKVEVVVLSPRHHHRHHLAPAPSPSELDAPAVAPTSAAGGSRGAGLALALALALAVGFLVFGLF